MGPPRLFIFFSMHNIIPEKFPRPYHKRVSVKKMFLYLSYFVIFIVVYMCLLYKVIGGFTNLSDKISIYGRSVCTEKI